MTDDGGRQKCEFQLLRYVPDSVRNEFVHIGAVLRATGPDGAAGKTEVRFTRDWRRVRCLDPDADIEVLEAMESELRRKLGEESDEKFKRILDESLSLNVQMTEPKALPRRERSGGNGRVDAHVRGSAEAGADGASARKSGDSCEDACGV